MKTKKGVIFVFIAAMIVLSCQSIQMFGPTATPLPTNTFTPTSIPSPTQTPTPNLKLYSPVPRWMILAQPGQSVEIRGETWNYTNDRWGETYACIDYTRENEPYLFFEQCFALTQPDLTFESQRDSFLNDGFEVLTPNNTFGDVGQISLMAKRMEDDSNKYIKFFEIFGTGEYIALVEMNFATEDPAPLQEIYHYYAADTIDYVLRDTLQKSRIIPRPTATPLSPTQESFYGSLVVNLITESEASALYGGTWEATGDFVSPRQIHVCHNFEDRTNADVLWVAFSNCIFMRQGSTFEQILEDYKEPGDVPLTSSYIYDDNFALFGYQKGHTKFYAWMQHGNYFYFVYLESRTLGGQEVEDVFNQEADDFIHEVLMINAQR
jgi:hypothetical protein